MASWVRGKCIGKGAFGTVNIAVAKSDGRVFAVKSVDRETALPGQLEALENEIRILRRMSSPHVITFLGDDVTCEGTTSYRNLHLEYMPGGTVADLDPADVDERLVRRHAWCLVHALRDVHAHGVVHCDVKGRNVLLAGDGSVAKLADFGSAVELSGPGTVPRGSPMWMAPEVIRREYQGPESDVWSLGCTVIEMVTGNPPWEDRGVDTLSRIGFSGELPEFPSGLSELGRDFLEKCLRREPRQRWSCDQLLQHPFLLIESTHEVAESSPRCVLDWFDSEFTESEDEMRLESENENENEDEDENWAKDRIGKLASGLRANWETEGWVAVRIIVSSEVEEASTTITSGGCECEEERRASWEFGNVARFEEEMEVGALMEYSDSGRIRTGENERVNREICRNGRLGWRCEFIVGGGCGWSCRYGYGGWEKLDRIKGISTIYTLSCKLIKSIKLYYLFSIYLNILIYYIYRLFYVVYYFLILLHCDKHAGSVIVEQIVELGIEMARHDGWNLGDGTINWVGRVIVYFEWVV